MSTVRGRAAGPRYTPCELGLNLRSIWGGESGSGARVVAGFVSVLFINKVLVLLSVVCTRLPSCDCVSALKCAESALVMEESREVLASGPDCTTIHKTNTAVATISGSFREIPEWEVCGRRTLRIPIADNGPLAVCLALYSPNTGDDQTTSAEVLVRTWYAPLAAHSFCRGC